MLNVDILCVGKIKERYLTDAIDEYRKRLGSYLNLNMIEVKDEKTPDKASEKEEELILAAEGERLSKYIDERAYVIAMAVEGKQYDSPAFSRLIEDIQMEHSKIQFVIGGSLGIEDPIKKRADELISFSKMTFPHQLMRVILLEQIYRAEKIMKREPYHK
ncbi:MAG: 23S rRNA (pseudouridine(1915)-N(3))-methyltransferase RlmH [Lachnospiraceae bacterium]|nr:23S rRNA (pseudouridine(1915)-N(3))-methyltransferase RlmH [Lachnospiraceae bacterium]